MLYRGLFEQHKLVFSFMLCGDIMRQQGIITDAEWNYLLRGSGGMDKVGRIYTSILTLYNAVKAKHRGYAQRLLSCMYNKYNRTCCFHFKWGMNGRQYCSLKKVLYDNWYITRTLIGRESCVITVHTHKWRYWILHALRLVETSWWKLYKTNRFHFFLGSVFS